VFDSIRVSGRRARTANSGIRAPKDEDVLSLTSASANEPPPREDLMASEVSRKIFVNLAVKDLDKSVAFFSQLGFAFDPRFTDDQATCMIISDEAFVMLLVEAYFRDFTTKQLCDATTHTEAILAVSADSREQVDDLVNKALAAGGSPANEPLEYESMYGWSFHDLDGHLWEVIWMGSNALE
jgi:predicted lactoylglutathione lyase